MWSSASFTASNPYACDSDAYIPNEKVNLQSSNDSIADTERNVKVRGTTNSKIPSIFDHVICNFSIIKSYYHQKEQYSSFSLLRSLPRWESTRIRTKMGHSAGRRPSPFVTLRPPL